MTPVQARAVYLEAPCAYSDALSLQEALHRLRLADRIPDTVLFLEHLPVVTLGRRGRKNFLLASPEELQQQGIDFHVASRGGDVTYHGPGQLVMYPILKFGTQEADAHGYLHNLESIAIETAAAFGVAAFRREGMSGAWTERGKIAAIGFQIKRWVTLHGLSFNVGSDLSGFAHIVGCGLEGEPISALQLFPGAETATVSAVRDVMCEAVERVLQRKTAVHRIEAWSHPDEVSQMLLQACSRQE